MDGTYAVPAPLLVDVQDRLEVCSWHGEPAVRRIRFALQSKPELPGSRLNSGNALATAGRLGAHFQKTKITRFTSWPLCHRCLRTRRVWMTLAIICFWGGSALVIGVIVASMAAGRPLPSLAAFFYTGLVMLPLALFPFIRGSLPRIVRARTSEDGSQVNFVDPHPRFVEQVRTMTSR
jgi:hypothetical protein